MARFLIPCSCGEEVRVDAAQAGDTVDCPVCGVSIEVPPLRALRKLKPAGQSEHPSDRQAMAGDRRPWRAVARLAIVVALVAAAPGLVLLASYRSPHAPESTHRVQQADETMTPLESWLLWIHIDAALLGEASPPRQEQANGLAKRRRRWLVLSLATASLALGVALLAWLVDLRQRNGRKGGKAPLGAGHS